MDRKKCKTLLKSGVLEAWAEGKPIQILSNDGLSWRDIDRDAMLFESSNAYRVKPEPVTVKVKAERAPNHEFTVHHVCRRAGFSAGRGYPRDLAPGLTVVYQEACANILKSIALKGIAEGRRRHEMIDLSKPLRTAAGLKVEDVRVENLKLYYPIKGVVDGVTRSWTLDGQHEIGVDDSPYDLVAVDAPPTTVRLVRYARVFRDEDGTVDVGELHKDIPEQYFQEAVGYIEVDLGEHPVLPFPKKGGAQ